MNRIYNIVWSSARGAWVVTSELATRRCKSGGAIDRRAAVRHFVNGCGAGESRSCARAWPLRLGILLALCPAAQATDYYWDIDGATAGAGGPTPSSTWSTTDATLSTDAAGATAVAARTTTTADRLFFSAGTDATGIYTVTVSGTQNIGRLTFQDGAVNLTGGTINFGGVSGVIDGDATPDGIASVIAGSGGLRFSGGTVTLNGTARQHVHRRDAGGRFGVGAGQRDPGGDRRQRHQRRFSADRQWRSIHIGGHGQVGRRRADQRYGYRQPERRPLFRLRGFFSERVRRDPRRHRSAQARRRLRRGGDFPQWRQRRTRRSPWPGRGRTRPRAAIACSADPSRTAAPAGCMSWWR